MNYKKNIMITGGAGFIGSHVVRRFVNNYPDYLIVNVDLLTYAGNLENLIDVEDAPNYVFIKEDICNEIGIKNIFEKYKIDSIIHLAAESHVDRSITDPMAFVKTNILGTCNLLNIAKEYWKDDFEGKCFYHISTDEVYGSLDETSLFEETTAYDPQSPYSASKASSDHFVRSYGNTYKMPFKISNCSNNYGPNQFPEKLIPLVISNILEGKSLPVYGKGENIRDWLYVEDHANAIDLIFHKADFGTTYNIGGHNEWKNIDIVKLICRLMDDLLGRTVGETEKLITFVEDRAGHDLRYAIDSTKLQKELGWVPSLQFDQGIKKTISWYLSNNEWLLSIKSKTYLEYKIKKSI